MKGCYVNSGMAIRMGGIDINEGRYRTHCNWRNDLDNQCFPELSGYNG